MGKYFKTWQDWAIGLGGFLLAPSLIPLVVHGPPPPLTTSGISAVVLWVFVVAFGTLKLPLSTVSTALSASAWSIMVIQSLL